MKPSPKVAARRGAPSWPTAQRGELSQGQVVFVSSVILLVIAGLIVWAFVAFTGWLIGLGVPTLIAIWLGLIVFGGGAAQVDCATVHN